jgi:hypothetical protein
MNPVPRLFLVLAALLSLSACSTPSIHVDPRTPGDFPPAQVNPDPAVERAPVERIRVVHPEPAPIRTKP